MGLPNTAGTGAALLPMRAVAGGDRGGMPPVAPWTYLLSGALLVVAASISIAGYFLLLLRRPAAHASLGKRRCSSAASARPSHHEHELTAPHESMELISGR